MPTQSRRMGLSGTKAVRVKISGKDTASTKDRPSISSVCLPSTSKHYPDPTSNNDPYHKLKIELGIMDCHIVNTPVDPSIFIKWQRDHPEIFANTMSVEPDVTASPLATGKPPKSKSLTGLYKGKGKAIKKPESARKLFSSSSSQDSETFFDAEEGPSSVHDDEFVYPNNMEQLREAGTFFQKAHNVHMERLPEDFVERAKVGAVDWRLHARNPTKEAMAYQLYITGDDASPHSNYRKMRGRQKKKVPARKPPKERGESLPSGSSSSSENVPNLPTKRKASTRSSSSSSPPRKVRRDHPMNMRRRKTHQRFVSVVHSEEEYEDENVPDSTTRDEYSEPTTASTKKSSQKPKVPVKKVISPHKKGSEADRQNIERLTSSFGSAFEYTCLIYPDGEESIISRKDRVLAHCRPKEITTFERVLTENMLKHITKIGEGSHGEVFLTKSKENVDVVVKVVPFDDENGELPVDSDDCFGKVLTELMICSAFNRMRYSEVNKSPNFIHLIQSAIVRGKFPKKLLEEWNAYMNRKWTENWDPRDYDKNHLFMVMILNNGGQDLESFKFGSAEEALGLVLQIIFSLAAAEAEYEFEHRDLHWGNVLLKKTTLKTQEFYVDDIQYQLPTGGVMASLIDFSLSRMQCEKNILYEDLASDEELFAGKGDLQYDVYRKMREHNQNNWQDFNPKTNIFWIDYLLDKVMKKKFRDQTDIHDEAFRMMESIRVKIMSFASCKDLVESPFMSDCLTTFKEGFSNSHNEETTDEGSQVASEEGSQEASEEVNEMESNVETPGTSCGYPLTPHTSAEAMTPGTTSDDPPKTPDNVDDSPDGEGTQQLPPNNETNEATPEQQVTRPTIIVESTPQQPDSQLEQP